MAHQENHSRAGTALMTATVMIVALAAIVTALIHLTAAEYARSRTWRDETRAFYVAEAGMNEAFATLVQGGRDALLALDYPRALGEGTYGVAVVLGEDDPELLDHRIRLTASGREGRARSAIEVIAHAIPNGRYRYAAFGEEGVWISSNVVIDSYDPSAGAYPGVAPAGYLGNVGANGDVVLASNVHIYGDVAPGPAGVMVDSASGAFVWGAIASADEEVVLDPVPVPSIALTGTGALTVSAPRTIGPGDLHYASLRVQRDELRIVGPAVLVVDDFTMLSNSRLVIDASLGPVEIHATGNFDLRSNTYVTTLGTTAKDVSLNLAGDTDGHPAATIQLNSNATFLGTIYAPDADLRISSNFEIFGSVMAESVTLASNTALHFDESLLYEDGVEPMYRQVSWRVLSQSAE